MAVTAFWYGAALTGQYSATAARRVDWVNDSVKVSLHTVTYVPNQDTHDFFDDATNELPTAGGYTAGGVTLAGKTANYTGGTNTLSLDANDVSWTSATFTARIAVIYVDTAGASTTDPLLGYVDFGGDQTVSSGTFTIQWHVDGLLKLVAA